MSRTIERTLCRLQGGSSGNSEQTPAADAKKQKTPKKAAKTTKQKAAKK